jgi:hypothetical protein
MVRVCRFKGRRQTVQAARSGVGAVVVLAQYFGAGALPPEALHDDLPPPLALHDDLPVLAGAAAPPAGAAVPVVPPAADGSVAPPEAVLPPPHAAVAPMSIPATADTARAFEMFMTVVSSPLLEKRRWGSVKLRAED